MVGPLAIVAAVWNQAWSDVCLENNWSASAREFLLNEVALDNLASVGIEPEAVRMIVNGVTNERIWVRRDVMRMFEGGMSLIDIVNNVDLEGCCSQRYARVRQIIQSEIRSKRRLK